MVAPKLDRRLVLESRDRVADGAGGFTETWIALGALWANIRPSSGRERRGEALTVSTTSYRIVVRAEPVGSSARPLPDQRFREGDRVFRVLAVTEEGEDGRFLTCFAREEVAT